MSIAIANEETLVIETPERVPLHFALASIGNRFLACAVDHGLQLFAMLLVVMVFLWTGYLTRVGDRLWDAPKWMQAAVIILMFVLWSGYFAIFEWRWNGQT